MILQPHVIGYLVLGVCMGLAIGVFPVRAGLSLLLPFMFGMEPLTGLALMVSMVAVVPTSDTFASVLMGIPGSSASQATVLEGFPMAKKGTSRAGTVGGFWLIAVWRVGRGRVFDHLHSGRAAHCNAIQDT